MVEVLLLRVVAEAKKVVLAAGASRVDVDGLDSVVRKVADWMRIEVFK